MQKDSLIDSIEIPDGLVHWNILQVEGPSVATVNQTIELEVTYPTSSGCDYVSDFRIARSKNFVYVKAFGSTLRDTPCTLAAIPKKINFEYTPTRTGELIFQFINKDNSAITHKIRID